MLVAYGALAAALLGSGNGLERKDDVDEAAKGLAGSLGLATIHGDVHHRSTAPGCAAVLHLEEDEAWYERNTFSIVGYRDGPAALYSTSVAFFKAAGFHVEELKAPLSGSRGLRAVRGDVGVLIDFVGPGAKFTIAAGPCAIKLSPINRAYEIVVA